MAVVETTFAGSTAGAERGSSVLAQANNNMAAAARKHGRHGMGIPPIIVESALVLGLKS